MFQPINVADTAGLGRAPVARIPFSDELDPEHKITYDTYDAYSDDHGFAGCTLREVAEDYNFELEFLVNSAVSMGVSPPVDSDRRLSSFLTGDQIFALLEAVTTLDPSEARDRFVDETLDEVRRRGGRALVLTDFCPLPVAWRTHMIRLDR